MTPDRWRTVQLLFHDALEMPPHRRASFLREACQGDDALREKVEALLDADAHPPSVLQASVDDLAGAMLGDETLAQSRRADRAGDPVGPYRIVREIGRGGMGTVYLAERADGQFEQRVALKLINRIDDHVVSRFLSERQILASLQHPNIARLYDGGHADDGRPYIAMEYVEGRPIDAYCDEQKLTIDQRLRLFQTVCDAVQYAHRNLVVHRDLKPANILISDDGRVKLLDFGIAKLLDDGAPAAMTQTGMRVMTPEYAAPEQVQGRPITTATDVYALGLVLYEVLTGRRPYDVKGKSLADAERTVTEERPDRPSTAVTKASALRRSDGTTATITPESVCAARGTTVDRLKRRLRGDIDRILLKALRKEPERRYSSAEAFLEDIKRHLAGMPVSARPDTPGYRFRKFVARNRVPVAAAALVLCSLVAGLSVALWQAEEARRERDTAQEVSTFLEELFTAADPFEASQTERLDTLRIRDFLARSADRVRADLKDQPAVQARLLTTLGRVHHQLGLYDEARPLLEQATAQHVGLYGRDHPAALESLNELASLFESQGAYVAADSLYRLVLAGYRRIHGAEHPLVASTMNNLGLVLTSLGAFEEAEQLHRDALAINRRQLEDDDPELAINLNMLAALLAQSGNNEEAEPLYRESLDRRRAHYGDEHPTVAIGLNNLAVLLRDEGRYDDAEPLIREALAINRAVFGGEHPHVADNLNLLGSVLRNKGDYDAAEPIFVEAIALSRKLYGERHPTVSIKLDTYAALQRAKGNYDEAERLELEAIDIARENFGDDHYAVAITTSKLAGIVYDKGEIARAERLYREAHERMRAHYPADHPSVVMLAVGRAKCLSDLGRRAEAEPMLLESFETLRAGRGGDDRYTRSAAEALVSFYEGRGRPDQAAAYRTAAE